MCPPGLRDRGCSPPSGEDMDILDINTQQSSSSSATARQCLVSPACPQQRILGRRVGLARTPPPLFLMFSLSNFPSPGPHLLPGCKFPLTCAVFRIEPSSVLMCPFPNCKSFLNKISFHHFHCRPPLFFL